MLSLRQSDGLDLSQVSKEFGQEAATVITESVKHHVKAGTVLHEEQSLRLKDPEGFLLSNSVISDIFVGLDR